MTDGEWFVFRFGQNLDRVDRMILKLKMSGKWPADDQPDAPRVRLRREVAKVVPAFAKEPPREEPGSPTRVLNLLRNSLGKLEKKAETIVGIIDTSALKDLRAQFNDCLARFRDVQ